MDAGVDVTAAPEAAPVEFVRAIYDAVMGGRYALAAVLALMGTVLLARYSRPAWFGGDVRGTMQALGLSVAGALVTALGAGRPVDWSLAATALGVGLAAIGGWSGIYKRLLVPLWGTWFAPPPATRPRG